MVRQKNEKMSPVDTHYIHLNYFIDHIPAGIYLLKVNNRNTRTKLLNVFKVNNEDTKTT